MPRYPTTRLGVCAAGALLILAAVMAVHRSNFQPNRTTPLVPGQQSPRNPSGGKANASRQMSFAAEFGPIPPWLADLSRSLASAEVDSEGFRREATLDELAHSIGQADLPLAIGFLHRGSSELAKDFAARLLRLWVELDAPSAASWAEGLDLESSEQQRFLDVVAVAWANLDLERAAQWGGQLSEPARSDALLLIANEVTRSEPAKALDLAMALPESPARDGLIAHALAEYAVRDPEAAAARGERLIDPTLRERALTEVALAWSQTNPAAAAEFALQTFPPGKQFEDALVGIVQRWAQATPQTVAPWVERFPEGVLKDTALEQLAKLWADADAQNCADWLNTLSSGWTRDVATGAYALQIAPRFPQVATDWVRSIEDPALREQQVKAITETVAGLVIAAP